MDASLQELEDLIQKFKQESNIKKKQVAYLNLVSETLKLVKKIVLGMYQLPFFVSREDLIQVGAIGALKSIETYQNNKNGSFKTYATICVKGKILQYLRDKAYIIKLPRDIKDNEIKNTISLDETVFSPDGAETVMDKIPSCDSEEDYENKKLIEYALNKLAKHEKEVIYKYYIEGLKKKEIAQNLDISAMQVTRIMRRALSKLYNIIKEQ